MQYDTLPKQREPKLTARPSGKRMKAIPLRLRVFFRGAVDILGSHPFGKGFDIEEQIVTE
jgi:hypothetical protein